MNEFDELIQNPVSRRAFLQRMTAAGLGTAAAALLAGCGGGGSSYPSTGTGLAGTGTSGTGTGTNGTTTTFFDNTNFPGIPGRNANEVVLNFALTLEILEADLYRQALNIAAGRSIAAPLDTTLPGKNSTGNYSQVVGNGSITNSGLATAGFLYLAQYAYVEAAHRDFLIAALQSFGAPVQTANANGYTLGNGIGAGTDLGTLLTTIYAAEETGVRAYEGAATYLTDLGLLTTAVAIHSTEARHSAGVAYILGKDTGPVFGLTPYDLRILDNANQTNAAPYHNNTFEYHVTPVNVLNIVKPFFK